MIELISEILKDSIGNFTVPEIYFTLWKLFVVLFNIVLLRLLFKKKADFVKVSLVGITTLLVGVLAVMNIPYAIVSIFALFLLSKLIEESKKDIYIILIAIISLFIGAGNVIISEIFYLVLVVGIFFLEKTKSE